MKDISEYDYIRLVVTSPNELNMQTYNGNEQLRTAAFPGAYTSISYEGGWIQTTTESIWRDRSSFNAGNSVKEEYTTRTVFIPIHMLIMKGMNPETLTAIAICPQSSDVEVTIHSIDFVKTKPKSHIGTANMEGLVCRPTVELLDRMGRRVITKIKVCDFAE